jgi:hypothetical protein
LLVHRGRAAKPVVVVTATGSKIADPDHGDILDVMGFDSATPNPTAEFVRETA